MEALIAFGSAASFAVGAGFLAAFFVTEDRRLDRVSDWAFVSFAGFSVALALVVLGRIGSRETLATIVTIVGIAGVGPLGIFELLLALDRIDFRRWGMAGVAGFAGWLAWIAGVSWISLTTGVLPAGLAWLGLASVAAGVVIAGRFATDRALLRGERNPGRAEMWPLVAVFVALVVWLVWLGLSV